MYRMMDKGRKKRVSKGILGGIYGGKGKVGLEVETSFSIIHADCRIINGGAVGCRGVRICQHYPAR